MRVGQSGVRDRRNSRPREPHRTAATGRRRHRQPRLPLSARLRCRRHKHCRACQPHQVRGHRSHRPSPSLAGTANRKYWSELVVLGRRGRRDWMNRTRQNPSILFSSRRDVNPQQLQCDGDHEITPVPIQRIERGLSNRDRIGQFDPTDIARKRVSSPILKVNLKKLCQHTGRTLGQSIGLNRFGRH